MKQTDKVLVPNDEGELVEMTAPVIISASRSTDIPAFYAKWFMNRLSKGYVTWVNPFNRKPMYVSFSKARAIVFWTKNPAPMIPYLEDLDRLGLNYYFQFSLNDYDAEQYEPNVPSVERRIEIFKKLSQHVGPECVIWRFDPILLTDKITPREILMRIWKVGNQLKGLTKRLVISFIDIEPYRKVKLNLNRPTNGTEPTNTIREPNQAEIDEIVSGLRKIRQRWSQEGWDLEIQSCSEKVDLSTSGISHTSCIDGELMEKLFAHDDKLMEFLRPKPKKDDFVSGDLFGNVIPILAVSNMKMKDTGQRKECGCVQSKDIGMYDTCAHFCAYCYANTSKEVVLKNMKKHQDNDECIVT